MCKKWNELIYKQQICRLIHKQQRPAQSQCGILEAFMIDFILMIFYWLEGMLTDRLQRKFTRKISKIQVKAWYSVLGTEILR